MQHPLGRLGIPAEVVRPPRHTRTESCGWAVRIEARQRVLGIVPCRIEYEGEKG